MLASRLRSLTCFLSACGLATTAFAQDSTSLNTGLPGDAQSPYSVAEQCDDFIVDLAPLSSSWGNGFAVAPLLKLPRSEPGVYFNNLPSATAISSTYAETMFDAVPYSLWSSPGQGISSTDNAAPSGSMTPVGSALQFAVAVADIAPVAGVQTSHITGAVVRVDPSSPARLYVQRRIAASSGTSSAESRSSLSIGSVNSQGVIGLRADAFGISNANAISGNNLLSVSLADRMCGQLNVIDINGGSDSAATDDVVRGSTTIISPPSILPDSSTLFAADFAGSLRFGSSGSTTGHLAASTPFTTTDHRGTTSFSPAVWFSGSIGTGAILAYQEISGPAIADAYGISVWGVDSQGAPIAAETVLFPAADPFGATASVIDNFDGHEIGNNAEPGSDWAFDQIGSQIPFRGANGSVAVNTDPSGRLIAAAHAAFGTYATGGRNSPVNAITVARLSHSASHSWTLAAWVDEAAPNGGKSITDGQGTIVGYLEQLDIATAGATQGPSISGPGVDSAGNVWFVASARYIDAGAPGGFRHETSLLRGVLDTATFSYELEAVLSTGDVINGKNSATNYRIEDLQLADRNSASSAAFAAGSVIGQPWLNGAAATDPASPSALGGLVVAATLVYDTNNDGQFISPAGSGGTPGSPDEEYEALMFVGVGDAAACVGDIADDFGMVGNPDGMVSFGDFLALLGLVGPCPSGPGCTGDIADDFGMVGNSDGMVSFGDFLALLGLVGPCQ